MYFLHLFCSYSEDFLWLMINVSCTYFCTFYKGVGLFRKSFKIIIYFIKTLIHFSFMLTNQNMFIIKLFHRSLTIAISLSYVLLLNAIALLVKVNSTRSIMKRRPTIYISVL